MTAVRCASGLTCAPFSVEKLCAAIAHVQQNSTAPTSEFLSRDPYLIFIGRVLFTFPYEAPVDDLPLVESRAIVRGRTLNTVDATNETLSYGFTTVFTLKQSCGYWWSCPGHAERFIFLGFARLVRSANATSELHWLLGPCDYQSIRGASYEDQLAINACPKVMLTNEELVHFNMQPV